MLFAEMGNEEDLVPAVQARLQEREEQKVRDTTYSEAPPNLLGLLKSAVNCLLRAAGCHWLLRVWRSCKHPCGYLSWRQCLVLHAGAALARGDAAAGCRAE